MSRPPEADAELPVRRHVAQIMGMPVSLALRGAHASSPAAMVAWERVVAELTEVDRVFSTYRADSWVSRLDRGEVGLPDCPPQVREVLALGQEAQEQTGGAFSVWRPDAQGRRRLDPSGVVKGWAVERAARLLAGVEDTDFCLSAGGDLVCHVAAPGREAWRIGIEDPRDPSRVLAVVPVRDGAVATSGAAHRGAHVVDARTGLDAFGVASVTVIGPSLTWADIDATAAYARGVEAAEWLRTRDGRTGFVVWPDGTTTTVTGGRAPRPAPR